MRASVALPSSGDAAAAVTARIAKAAAIVERRRWWIVGALVVAQWLIIRHYALHGSFHNGWVYSDGDDGPWYWTAAWALSSWHIGHAAIGLGWPYVMAPLAAVFGPDMANGLPAVIALDVVVLAPAAVVGMYLLGERLAGKLFGVWSAALFVAAPVLAVELYAPRARPTIVNDFLPTAMGLNALSDYPSMVCAIFSAYLVLRAWERNRVADGLLCGLALGFLLLMKPGNGPLPLAAVLLLAVTFRFRALLATLAATVPGVVALTLWKRVGTGVVPAVSSGTGSHPSSAPTAAVSNAHRYINIDFHHLAVNLHDLGEIFWSVRFLEYLLVAGAIGLVARARWKGAFVVGWLIAFGLIKGTVSYSRVFDTSVYRFLLPAWPAWVLIVAGVVYCWPVGPSVRMRQRSDDDKRRRSLEPPSRRLLIAVAALLALGPLAVAVAAPPVPRGTVVQQNYTGSPIAVVDFHLRARQLGTNRVELSWSAVGTSRAQYWYRVFKSKDAGCYYPSTASHVCRFTALEIGNVRSHTFVDSQAVGHVLYRVAIAPGRRLDPNSSGLLLMSKPATVTVG